ncbi:MAG: hypothetical protein GF364_14715 [Candidatus Lokiarchaeota archaeon]|nr:hypothetical protein [Candidatus Lokiarchaeota archaeon]
MSYVPKYILKRVVPKDGLFNIDVSGDGNIDGFAIKYVNVLTPIELPENMQADDLKDQFVGAWIDEEKYTLEQLNLHYNGKTYSLNDIDSLMGTTIPVGGIVYILANKSGGLHAGKHIIKLATQYQGTENKYELKRDLYKDGKCQPLPEK